MIYTGLRSLVVCIFSPIRRCFNDPDAPYTRPCANFTLGTNGELYYSIV
jgi:hypothetical protein